MNFRKLLFEVCLSIAIVLILRYGLLENINQYIYDLRNTYFLDFSYRYDDFLPYIPLILLFILKVAGIKSRSNWKQMIVSVAFSFALMGLVVTTVKSISGVLRPDGSDFLSFPSGHTASAFTSGCVLLKEYGSKYRWIGGSAIFLAVLTGITRILNNRHWLSDALAGALIGFMSVEIGYFLSDFVFRKKMGHTG